jgi:TolB protein
MRNTALVAALAVVISLGALPACGDSGVEPVPLGIGPKDVIAFGARNSGAGGGHALYLVRPDSTELRKLSDELGTVFFPRWSPAGDKVAYIVAAEDGSGPGALRIYDFATSTAVTVSDNALPDATGPAVSWSRDSRQLAFVEAGTGLRVYNVVRAGLEETDALDGATPDWSPARDELALIVDDDVWRADDDGGDAEALLERVGAEGNPRWSPDGERLAFWSAPDGAEGGRDLLVVERGGGELVELGSGSGAAWSPDGLRLAFQRSDGAGSQDIFVVEAPGSEPRRLSESVAQESWPVWSARGDRIAYAALVDQRTAFLCVVTLDPEGRDCLDLPGLIVSAPAWSPE